MNILKITPVQYQLLKNHPIHYELNVRFSDKDQMYEIECDNRMSNEIKKIVDN